MIEKRTERDQNKRMKRTIITAISLMIMAACLLPLCGCALFKGPISDDQAREILADVLPGAAVLNRWLWGEVPTATEVGEEDAASSVCMYYPVSSDCPYSSVEEMKADVDKYYTPEMAEIIYAYAFDNSDTTMSRFCNQYGMDGTPNALQVDVTKNHEPYSITTVVYLDSVKVTRSAETIIECTVDSEVGSKGTERELTLTLIFEDDLWKLDSYNWIAEVKDRRG